MTLLVQPPGYLGNPLKWHHNECDGVSNHQPCDCLLNRLFKAQIKENIKPPRHWPLWGEFTENSHVTHEIASKTSRNMRFVLSSPLVYKALWLIMCDMIWHIRHNYNRPDDGHSDVTGHRNPPVTCGFPSQKASNAENVSFDDVIMLFLNTTTWRQQY